MQTRLRHSASVKTLHSDMATREQSSESVKMAHSVRRLALCVALFSSFWFLHSLGVHAQSNQLQLKMVQVVFRHGNRTPEFPYFNDPNAHETFYPYGWDELDEAGRQKAYNLGSYLKNLYGWFVGNEYVPGVINITSTDINRTKMCAQLVAAGLFPPSDLQKWGTYGGIGSVWQPITFSYIPKYEDDFMYMGGVSCPAYDEEKKRATVHPEVTAVLENDPELVDAVATNAHVGRNVHDIETFHQTLRIEAFKNLIVPDWVKPFYPDRFFPIGKMHFKANVWTRKMQRLYGGPLLKHMLEKMELHKKGSPTKMWLYSGHDDTISRLGMTMRVWGDIYPDFSNAIIVELHGDPSGNLFVKTLFHNDTSKPPTVLTVKGCEELCSLDKIRMILDDVIPRDRKAECLQKSGSSNLHLSCLPLLIMLFTASTYIKDSLVKI